MRDFLFPPEQARTPIGKLSGGERGRLMLAQGAGEAVQPDRSRRADQRPRHRDARPPAGAARRLCRDDPPRQPRPRFSRSRRDLGHCRRRRRALGRICGRLFRHGRPARVWACRSARRAGRDGAKAGQTAAGRARGAQAQARLQREAGARNAARAHRQASRRARRARAANSPTPTSPPASRPRSGTRRNFTRTCATRSPAPRTNGSGSRSCARSLSGSRPA